VVPIVRRRIDHDEAWVHAWVQAHESWYTTELDCPDARPVDRVVPAAAPARNHVVATAGRNVELFGSVGRAPQQRPAGPTSLDEIAAVIIIIIVVVMVIVVVVIIVVVISMMPLLSLSLMITQCWPR
jgi:hypothetical protein